MVGLRLRTQSSRIHQELFRALGCDPVPMSLGDAFVALQQGAIDGFENSYSGMYDSKTYEICKFGAITNHVYTPAIYFMCLDRWNELTPAEQAMFLEAGAIAAKVARAENRRQEAAAVKNLEVEGMKFTTADLTEFRKKAMTVYDAHPELADSIAAIRDAIR
jgi:TRAP-type C4-dicarboxylate transport system substrate-binding protein